MIPVQRPDEYRSHYGSDAGASEMMQHCQTGDCGDGDHRTAKTVFYSGKLIRPRERKRKDGMVHKNGNR